MMMGGFSLSMSCCLVVLVLACTLWYLYSKDSFCKVVPFCGNYGGGGTGIGTDTNPGGVTTTAPGGVTTTVAPPAGGDYDFKCLQSSDPQDKGSWLKVKKSGSTVLCSGPDKNSCYWASSEDACKGQPNQDGLVCTQTSSGWCKDGMAGSSSGPGAGAPAGGNGQCYKLPAFKNKEGNLYLNSDLSMNTGCNESIGMYNTEIKLNNGTSSPCLSQDLAWVTPCGTSDPKIQWEAFNNVNEGANGNWYLIKAKGTNNCLAANGAGGKVSLQGCDGNKPNQFWWQINPSKTN